MGAVITPIEREVAWWALHDALPPGWRLGEMTFDPADEMCVLAAMSPRPHGRGKRPKRVVVGRGVNVLAAVRALTAALVGPR
jgi:hypothetical protein